MKWILLNASSLVRIFLTLWLIYASYKETGLATSFCLFLLSLSSEVAGSRAYVLEKRMEAREMAAAFVLSRWRNNETDNSKS